MITKLLTWTKAPSPSDGFRRGAVGGGLELGDALCMSTEFFEYPADTLRIKDASFFKDVWQIRCRPSLSICLRQHRLSCYYDLCRRTRCRRGPTSFHLKLKVGDINNIACGKQL